MGYIDVTSFEFFRTDYLGARSDKAIAYTRGVKTSILYQKSSMNVPSRIMMSNMIALVLAARVQSTAVLPDESRTVQAILKQVQQSPRVLAKLGNVPENASKLYNYLRQYIDPLEYNPSCWTWKIRHYERWLAAEEKAFPKVRGESRKTRARICTAMIYAQAGCSKVVAARMLGISPSTISNWIARGLWAPTSGSNTPYPDLAPTPLKGYLSVKLGPK